MFMKTRTSTKRLVLYLLISVIITVCIKSVKYNSTNASHEIFTKIREAQKLAKFTIQENISKTANRLENKMSPRNIILWTSWGSGSTYTGELLAKALPNTFYSIEPLHYFKEILHHENNSFTLYLRDYIHGLLNCNINSSYQKVVEYLSKQPYYLQSNTYLTNKYDCRKHSQSMCGDIAYVNKACKESNIHVMKLIRLSLKWAWSLLRDDNLDLQIIYLVRDPRAVIQSRMKEKWCKHETCSDPKTVCEILDEDLQEAKKMVMIFPNKFKMIQYEVLCSSLLKNLDDIMSFLGLHVTDRQMEIINRKTGNSNRRDITRKDSKTQLNRWRVKSDFETIFSYQKECLKPISDLGLRVFNSENEFTNVSLPVLLSKENTPYF